MEHALSSLDPRPSLIFVLRWPGTRLLLSIFSQQKSLSFLKNKADENASSTPPTAQENGDTHADTQSHDSGLTQSGDKNACEDGLPAPSCNEQVVCEDSLPLSHDQSCDQQDVCEDSLPSSHDQSHDQHVMSNGHDTEPTVPAAEEAGPKLTSMEKLASFAFKSA